MPVAYLSQKLSLDTSMSPLGTHTTLDPQLRTIALENEMKVLHILYSLENLKAVRGRGLLV
jgi:hypothetical protein